MTLVFVAFVLGVVLGLAIAIGVAVWLALRAHKKQTAARFAAQTAMADVRARASADGRLVETHNGAIQ